LWLQAVPDPAELANPEGYDDPLTEEGLSPIPNLVHRYPNRVLWLVNHECAIHCRFCTRKRRWSDPVPLSEELLREGIDYIRKSAQVKDVLLSGGDPLLLPVHRLERILASLRRIPHVEIIRIGTRVPCAIPQRVTSELARMLAAYHPLYVNVHFNHPLELAGEAIAACGRLAGAGIPLGSQTVLLRGVNDEADTLGSLFEGLLRARVRPYYLMQMDLTRSTAHFRTPVGTGLKVLATLRNRISGLAIPHFVIDLPGGHGKIPLTPNHVERIEESHLVVRDTTGRRVHYPLLGGEGDELASLLTGRLL
jgi:lysine 2,3-aminomutase